MSRIRWGLYREIYSLELRRRMAYRSEFWFKFLGVLFANLAAAYFLWKAVFAVRGAEALGGFTLSGMVLYYLIVPLIEGISRPQEQGFLSFSIYDGTLSRYLVYPVSFFPYQYVVSLATATMAVFQMCLVLGIYALVTDFPPEMVITPTTLFLGICTAFAASLLNFILVSIVEMAAFWAENVWSLSVMLMFSVRLLGGAMLPLTLFPEAMQRIIMATPFPYMVFFPIQALTGKLSMLEWSRGMGVLIAWTLALSLLNWVIWRRGNLRFTGVGQ